jgi:hypothetical protein
MDEARRLEEPQERSGARASIVRRFAVGVYELARENKRWWIPPIVVVLVLMLAIPLLGGSELAPFTYPLF